MSHSKPHRPEVESSDTEESKLQGHTGIQATPELFCHMYFLRHTHKSPLSSDNNVREALAPLE